MNHDTTHSETGEENHSLADFTINRLHEAIEIANKSADDQMFQKREAEAEVERLRELLNRAIKISEEIRDLPAYIEFDGNAENRLYKKACKEIEGLKALLAPATEEPANPICANTTHKFSHCDCKELAPIWRKLGEDEVIQKGDEWKNHYKEWRTAGEYFIGKPVHAFRGGDSTRFRTRRPLPTTNHKQISTKLVVEPKQEMPLDIFDYHLVLCEDAGESGDLLHCLCYLRDEVQKLKEAK